MGTWAGAAGSPWGMTAGLSQAMALWEACGGARWPAGLQGLVSAVYTVTAVPRTAAGTGDSRPRGDPDRAMSLH